MSEEKRRILDMVEQGTITQEDAARLLEALGDLLPARSAAQARQTPTSGGNGAAEKTKKPPAE